MAVTLRQMEVFVAIARHGNVTRAAAEVFLSQSAASMALAEMEKQLGGRLFDRQGKRLLVNERGRALLPRAQEVLARVQEIEELFGNQEGRLAPELAVWQMNHDDLKATNDFGQERVRPVTRTETVAVRDGGFTFTFPAHSLTILRMQLE